MSNRIVGSRDVSSTRSGARKGPASTGGPTCPEAPTAKKNVAAIETATFGTPIAILPSGSMDRGPRTGPSPTTPLPARPYDHLQLPRQLPQPPTSIPARLGRQNPRPSISGGLSRKTGAAYRDVEPLT